MPTLARRAIVPVIGDEDVGTAVSVELRDDELPRVLHDGDLAREDRLLGAHYVDVDGVGHYFSVFAFSKASSIAPTM